MRVMRFYAEHISRVLCAEGTSIAWTSGIEYDFVAEVPEDAHNASIIEQLRLQGMVDALARRDLRAFGEGVIGYVFRSVSDEAKTAAEGPSTAAPKEKKEANGE